MTIHKKLAEVQQNLHAPKNQTNNFGGYNYRNCEDILQAVKPLLKDCTIVIYDDIVEVAGRVYVKATAVFSDGKESVSNSAFAREALTKKGMDESQITGAASSYARKYALNGLLLIDDNKDADSQQPVDDTEEYNALVEQHMATISCIKTALDNQDLSTAKEAWDELTNEEKTGLWRAPSKGGCFSTEQRKTMQSKEFREAH